MYPRYYQVTLAVNDDTTRCGRSAALQGLRLVWIDRETDTALFELLSDIPPEVGATLQGWDARGIDIVDGNSDEQKFWFNINHPAGDMAKFSSGV